MPRVAIVQHTTQAAIDEGVKIIELPRAPMGKIRHVNDIGGASPTDLVGEPRYFAYNANRVPVMSTWMRRMAWLSARTIGRRVTGARSGCGHDLAR